MDLRDCGGDHGAKKYLNSFDKDQMEIDRITKRTSEAKDKMNNDKDTNPKYISVTDQIMNAYRM